MVFGVSVENPGFRYGRTFLIFPLTGEAIRRITYEMEKRVTETNTKINAR